MNWIQDHTQSQERHDATCGLLVVRVHRAYRNPELFEAGVIGIHGRWLKRQFATLEEAKQAAEKFARKIVKEITEEL